MTATVVSLTERQALPWITKARRLLPIISDREAARLLTSGLTLRGIMSELFRMVTQDPAWLAANIANDNHQFGCAFITDEARSGAGAATFDGVIAAPSTSRRPYLLQVATVLPLLPDPALGPLSP